MTWAWLSLLLGASASLAGCTLTLEFDGYADAKPEGGTIAPPCEDPTQAHKADCNVVADLTPGTIASGFTLDWKSLPTKEVVSAFVDGEKLVLGVHILGGEGIVMSVALADGTRKLEYGHATDIAGTPHEAGSGSGLDFLRSLVKTTEGTWVAHVWPDPATFEGSLVTIDPVTSTRSNSFVLMSCSGSDDYPRSTHSLVDPSGDAVWIAYHTVDSDDGGVYRISENACERFPTPGVRPKHLADFGGKIWLLDLIGEALGVFDPVSKATTLVPGKDHLGSNGLLVTSSTAWTIDSEIALAYTRVDPVSGARDPLSGVTGPARFQVEHPPLARAHPTTGELVLALDGAIVFLNPNDRKSRIVSY